MPSLIGNMLSTYATPMQKFACGVLVQIKRGALIGDEITAIVDALDDDANIHESGAGTVIHARNYEIDVALYQVNGEVVAPEMGDILLETINGVDRKFKILPVEDKPAFELDEDCLRWLVRTKRVA